MAKPYKPPSSVGPVLDSIESLLAHPRTKTIADSFIGKAYLCTLPGGQLFFESNLELDTDGSVYSAHTFDPTGQPATTAKDARGNYLDADKINFFVLPKGGFDAQYGIQVGDIGVVINGRRKAYACYADRGPANKLGEGSISLHRALGHETIVGGRLVNEGMGPGVITIIFPSSGNGLGRSNEESATIGEPLFLKLQSEGFAYEMQLLARFRSRQIVIPPNKGELELKLFDWVQELVDNTPHPPNLEGLHPASYLMATADGVNTLLYAPIPMAVADKAYSIPPRTVYADFALAKTPAGRWYVQHVTFHLSPMEQAAAVKAEAEATKAELKADLLEKAKLRR